MLFATATQEEPHDVKDKIYTRIVSARLDALLAPRWFTFGLDARLAEAAVLLRNGKRSSKSTFEYVYADKSMAACNGDPAAYIEAMSPARLDDVFHTLPGTKTDDGRSRVGIPDEYTPEAVMRFYRILSQCPTPSPDVPGDAAVQRATGQPRDLAWVIIFDHGGVGMLTAAFDAGIGIGSGSACAGTPGSSAGRPQLDLPSAIRDMAPWFSACHIVNTTPMFLRRFLRAITEILDKGALPDYRYAEEELPDRLRWTPVRAKRDRPWMPPLAAEEWQRVFCTLAVTDGAMVHFRQFCDVAYANGYKADILNDVLPPALHVLANPPTEQLSARSVIELVDAATTEAVFANTPAPGFYAHTAGHVDLLRCAEEDPATFDGIYDAWAASIRAYIDVVDELAHRYGCTHSAPVRAEPYPADNIFRTLSDCKRELEASAKTSTTETLMARYVDAQARGLCV